jgi:hypothetical protein
MIWLQNLITFDYGAQRCQHYLQENQLGQLFPKTVKLLLYS